MRIVQKGKIGKKKEYKGKCPECSTCFIFNIDDGVWGDNYSESLSGYFIVRCPLCKNAMYTKNLKDLEV